LPVTAVCTEAAKPAEGAAIPLPVHAAWLGCHWQTDAQQTGNVLATLKPDWLVVDHYALDRQWEMALKPHYGKLMVIDDLADRDHACDLLLDQNLGRQPEGYAKLVPAQCQALTGPRYALLRPEFSALRAYSLQRRQNNSAIRQLLITMGGVDRTNATAQVLQALKNCPLPADSRITVVMGLAAPWLQNVRELAAQLPWPTDVVVNVNDMAQRMADSDLAIGAAGSTSWERCCLGLPTLMVVLADNQKEAAAHIQNAGAANYLALNRSTNEDLQTQFQALFNVPEQLNRMTDCASTIADGSGADRVVDAMRTLINNHI
jgi:UDP-2,4-diacetamido-2,4,6-trideoxy-beta-L-altropyranose hydrolase